MCTLIYHKLGFVALVWGYNMAYPCLIPKWAFNKLAEVSIAGEGVNEDGEITPELQIAQDCNIQFKAEQKLDNKKQSVNLTGKAYFEGDICPNIRIIKGGKLTCDGVDYEIHAGSKALNFDGSVNYTELEFI
jgi:hypothetical protein